jgi:HK97 family phage major capsid protein
MDKRSQINDLSEQRKALREGLDAMVNGAVEAKRELSADESERFDREETQIRSIDAQVSKLDEQLRADEQHAETMRRYAPSVTILSEPEVYRKGGDNSYFKDLFRSKERGDSEATARLARNDKQVAEARALTTGNGAGGELVPPLWLTQDFVRYARPARITANLVPNLPLPAGTNSINIPKIQTGTQTALQTTQNSQVQVTDLSTTEISSSVFTIAGGQTISLQLLEQSPVNMDGLVLQDLAAAYAVNLNSLVLSGTGASGQPTGILTLSGTNAIDCPAPTGAQTLAGQIYKAVANAIAQVNTKRFLPPDTIIMHPVRWASLLSQVDSTGRPLVVPAAGDTARNPLGLAAEVASQGFVGTMAGLDVYVDALIPTNLTADSGTGEDVIIVARLADLMLWESDIRAEAFQQTYANNLSVFVRLYNYASFQAARHPNSVSVITGSALTAPTFL